MDCSRHRPLGLMAGSLQEVQALPLGVLIVSLNLRVKLREYCQLKLIILLMLLMVDNINLNIIPERWNFSYFQH